VFLQLRQFFGNLFADVVPVDHVGDVQVNITDSTGKLVFSLPDCGPYLYLTMKPGDYSVEAVYAGNVQKFKAKVPASGAAKLTIRVAG
jgi:hypothetical protein